MFPLLFHFVFATIFGSSEQTFYIKFLVGQLLIGITIRKLGEYEDIS